MAAKKLSAAQLDELKETGKKMTKKQAAKDEAAEAAAVGKKQKSKK